MSQLNPHFLIEIATEFLKVDGLDNTRGDPGDNNIYMRGINILEKLVNKSPGFIEVQYTLANSKFCAGDNDEAYKTCNLVKTLIKYINNLCKHLYS